MENIGNAECLAQMSVRDFYAGLAMLGLLASTNWMETGADPEDVAVDALQYADVLIEKIQGGHKCDAE